MKLICGSAAMARQDHEAEGRGRPCRPHTVEAKWRIREALVEVAEMLKLKRGIVRWKTLRCLR